MSERNEGGGDGGGLVVRSLRRASRGSGRGDGGSPAVVRTLRRRDNMLGDA